MACTRSLSTPACWPEIGEANFSLALQDFASRKRTYGARHWHKCGSMPGNVAADEVEFGEDDLSLALRDFASRERTYGARHSHRIDGILGVVAED
eukprot:gene23098-30295_t